MLQIRSGSYFIYWMCNLLSTEESRMVELREQNVCQEKNIQNFVTANKIIIHSPYPCVFCYLLKISEWLN